MAYEDSAGLNVHNQYCPRSIGGEQGVYPAAGLKTEFVVDLPLSGLNYKFPVRNNVKVVGYNDNFAEGTVSAFTVGGVDVTTATESAPVSIGKSNSGVIAQTGGTGGYVILVYENVAGDAYTLDETDV